MSKITYVITVCNEEKEFYELCQFLSGRVSTNDIVVLADENKIVHEIRDIASSYKISLTTHPMNGDFSEFRNSIGNTISDGWIFYIDADEVPSEGLINNMSEIIDELEKQEIYIVGIPRLNIVDGITQEYIDKWRWRANDVILDGVVFKNAINFPDMQFRLHKAGVGIKWEGKVHERLIGSEYCTVLDYREGFYLKHFKSINRQISQNELYEKITYSN